MNVKDLFQIVLLLFVSVGILYVFQSTQDKNGTAVQVRDYAQYITVNDASSVSPGLVLIPFSGSDKIILIDNKGQLKHQWNVDVDRARLDKDGNLLAIHGSKFRHEEEPWNGLRNTVSLYDATGKDYWNYTVRHPAHHDVQILDNGNILFLTRDYLPKSRWPELKNKYRQMSGLEYDVIVEVNPERQEVWRWSALDHFDLNFCGVKDCDYRTKRFGRPLKEKAKEDKQEKARLKIRDWTHANTISVIPENKWYNQGDSRFKPGNIIFMAKNFQIFFILDRQTGEIVFKETGDFFGGIGNAHEPHMIPEGYSGAGNILIFVNDGIQNKKQSTIVEFDPVNRKVVWTYQSKNFFNATRGSLQRLLNGNTFISEDNTGRVFEVNKNGKMVWEFQAPEPVSRGRRYE